MSLLPLLVLASSASLAWPPLQLHPENPHYFSFRGKPTVLVTSGEHYGAVLNLDFDYRTYLDELQRHGFNLTRTFSGTYREVPGSFKIRGNTLAPRASRFSCPWGRQGDTFDLDRFDDDHFRRLRDFVSEAGRRGIVVEYVLFCPLYEDELWDVSPMNAKNNRNGVGRVPRTEVFTLKHEDLLEHQLAFVRKAVAELNAFDNVYFEICNEPYFGDVTLEWQRRVADAIVATEKGLPNKHLIAQNIANGKAEIKSPHPAVSIFNFHYASPPDAVRINWHLNKPIGFDETGFQGTADRVYRRQAWEFLMAGGAVFSNLDYSFTTEHEDGTAEVEVSTPGGGGPVLRTQLGFLKKFVEGFDLVHVSATTGFVKTASPAEFRGQIHGLADRRAGAYAIYVPRGPKVSFYLELPPGRYHAEWIDPRDGKSLRKEEVDAGGQVTSPEYAEDIVIRINIRKDDAK
jgi:hypothetical protein